MKKWLETFLVHIKSSKTLFSHYSTKYFGKTKKNLYLKWLSFLANRYKQCAVSDIIVIADNIKIEHELRDFKFEKKLSDNGFDIRPKYASYVTPYQVKQKFTLFYARLFKLQDKLTLSFDNREVELSHGMDFSIFGAFKGEVELSVFNDIIIRSKIRLTSNKKENKEFSIGTHSANGKSKENLAVVFGEEKSNNTTSTIIEDKKDMEHKQKIEIKKKGFTIDTSF